MVIMMVMTPEAETNPKSLRAKLLVRASHQQKL